MEGQAEEESLILSLLLLSPDFCRHKEDFLVTPKIHAASMQTFPSSYSSFLSYSPHL